MSVDSMLGTSSGNSSIYPVAEDRSEKQTAEYSTQTATVDAKEFREDFVQHSQNMERALAITAIVVSVIVIIAGIAAMVHSSLSMSQVGSAAADRLFVLGDVGATLSGAAVLGSLMWLGSTFSREGTKESMEKWFAEMKCKKSLKAIYEEFYNKFSPSASQGVAPAVRERILLVEEGEKLSLLMSQYRELSDKEGSAAKWLESEWTKYLDENTYTVREASVAATEDPLSASQDQNDFPAPSAPPLSVVDGVNAKAEEGNLIDLTDPADPNNNDNLG